MKKWISIGLLLVIIVIGLFYFRIDKDTPKPTPEDWINGTKAIHAIYPNATSEGLSLLVVTLREARGEVFGYRTFISVIHPNNVARARNLLKQADSTGIVETDKSKIRFNMLEKLHVYTAIPPDTTGSQGD